MLLDLIQNFLSFVAPDFCFVCDRLLFQRSLLCAPCSRIVKPPVTHHLKVTAKKEIKVYSMFLYQGPFKKIVSAKFSQDTSPFVLAAQMFAQGDIIKISNLHNSTNSLLVPIPIHWTRMAKRGFNQADIFASSLSKSTGAPVMNALCRVRKTDYQFKLSKDDKQKNLNRAFKASSELNSDHLAGKDVVLVDDLCTSGITLKEASKTIWKYNPNSVSAVVICRAV